MTTIRGVNVLGLLSASFIENHVKPS